MSSFQGGVPLYTEVSSFQGVGIEGFQGGGTEGAQRSSTV